MGHGSGRRPPMLVRRGLRHGARGRGRCHGLGAARRSACVGLHQEPRRARFIEGRLAPLLPIGGVAFSGDLGFVKSDADFYGQAEVRLGVVGLGRSVVFLDDSSSNVEAAARHGWTAIHFTKEQDWRHEVTSALERAQAVPDGLEPD
jgi:beta-phosphoglucomutase-like phosphatase (HAD superfamily)